MGKRLLLNRLLDTQGSSSHSFQSYRECYHILLAQIYCMNWGIKQSLNLYHLWKIYWWFDHKHNRKYTQPSNACVLSNYISLFSLTIYVELNSYKNTSNVYTAHTAFPLCLSESITLTLMVLIYHENLLTLQCITYYFIHVRPVIYMRNLQ